VTLAIGNQSMRILQLISSAGYYGAENVLVCLAESLRSAGHENLIGVFHNQHRPNTEIADRARTLALPTVIFPCRGRLDRDAIASIQQCVRDNDIDLIHTHGYKSNIYGILAARAARVPMVATCHNWPALTLPLRLYSILDRMVLHKANHVVAVSENVRRRLRHFAISRRKISVIQNGVDTRRFASAQPVLRQELGLNGRTVVGAVGRLSSEKGHKFLLEAAPRLFAEFPDLAVVFVGAGPEQPALESLAKEFNLQDRVFFAGFRNDMPQVYASIDIFVLPSLEEAMPLTMLEAMAAGLPVVASDVGDIGKTIGSSDCGLLVQPGSAEELLAALARVLRDPALRAALGANARARVHSAFSIQRTAAQYLEVYQSVLHARRSWRYELA